MMLQRFALVTVLLVTGGLSGNGQTGELNRQIVVGPSDLKWAESPTGSGQRSAPLLGDQFKAGPYVRRVRLPPNTVFPPHSHSDDRQVTVLSGTLYLGHGTVVDKDHAIKAGAGTFFTEPGKNVHFEMSGPEEVIAQVSGTGPTSTNYVK